MATTSSLAGSKSFGSSLNSQTRQNLFIKIQHLESCLETIHSDLYRLEEQAKSVHDEKINVQNYLQERAQQTRGRLMSELNSFENEVRALIGRSKKETQKIDQKINLLKNGQLSTMQMILSLQRRVREVEVQLGSS